jgi:hypothetical protein
MLGDIAPLVKPDPPWWRRDKLGHTKATVQLIDHIPKGQIFGLCVRDRLASRQPNLNKEIPEMGQEIGLDSAGV